MSGGITALEGFDYQAMVALELILQHFDEHGSNAKGRPEGVDDLDLEYLDADGLRQRILVQVKKPRQAAEGTRSPEPWGLRDVLAALLCPRWTNLQEENIHIWWVLGDTIGPDVEALLGTGDTTAVWAARRAAAEWLTRDQYGSAKEPGPTWESPFRGDVGPDDSVAEATKRWCESFSRRAARAGMIASAIAEWTAHAERTHEKLDAVVASIVCRARYAEASDLRQRLVESLHIRFGLAEREIRDIVFRNLRGFIDDVARVRSLWIDREQLENEILQMWPRRVATVLPPPLPSPHCPRPAWIERLSALGGGIVGPSGAGKTTSATELYHHLRQHEPSTLVLYAEVRHETSWRNVLEGVAFSVGRRNVKAPYALLPSLRAGDDETVLRMADTLEETGVALALLIDLIEGTASEALLRDLARFAQRLPQSPATRLWIFGQEDALSELSELERQARNLTLVSIPGLDWSEFLNLAKLHGLTERSVLHDVFDALSSGRSTGVAPRVADAVFRLGTVEAALEAARSDNVLLSADAKRYGNLPSDVQGALGALACIAHPFRTEQGEATFRDLPVQKAIHAGLRVGLLHSLSDGRTEFHETVRRNILSQLSASAIAARNAQLADESSKQGDRVLEAHYAELAGQAERAREAGRAAFFSKTTADRIGLRAAVRGWVDAAEVLSSLRDHAQAPYGWWLALGELVDDDTTQGLLSWWREMVTTPGSHQALWQVPRTLLPKRPEAFSTLLELVAANPGERNHHYGASALGRALRDNAQERELLARFDVATSGEQASLADVLYGVRSPQCLARWLRYLVETEGTAPTFYGSREISEDHVVAIIDGLPEPESTELLARRDWGFGAATPFLWGHRDIVGSCAAKLLQDDHLTAARARVALRLLGLTAHNEFLDAARRWTRIDGAVQAVALTAPLLVREEGWRHELASLALDSASDDSLRTAAFSMYLQSGDGGEDLLLELSKSAAQLVPALRLAGALTFVVRPSTFTLELLLDELTTTQATSGRQLFASALSRAGYFADRPDAPSVARRLVSLLDEPQQDVWLAVLTALTMLRQPVALDACVGLAVAQGGTPIGAIAAMAACASRPQSLAVVEAALAANPQLGWLHDALIGRFSLQGMSDPRQLLEKARNADETWTARRRALVSLERLPYTSDMETMVRDILRERPLLAGIDSITGHVTAIIAPLIEDEPALFAELWSHGEEHFVDALRQVILDQRGVIYRANVEQVEACLRAGWQATQAALSAGLTPGKVLRFVVDRIHCAQVQAAALRLASVHNKADILEDTMRTSHIPWLVFRAVLERMTCEPRAPDVAARCSGLVSEGPCATDASLLTSMRNALNLKRTRGGPRERAGSAPERQRLTFCDIEGLLDCEQSIPRGAEIAEINDAELAILIKRLDFVNDRITTEGVQTDAERVSLRADGSTLRRAPITSKGRGGDRIGLRARLLARFPDRVPDAWFNSERQGHGFVAKLIPALADQGDPRVALTVLKRLGNAATEILSPQNGLYGLGQIADSELVDWIAYVSGTGGPAQVEALAEFARSATGDAAIPLLSRLMHRVRGHVARKESSISHEPHDPWRKALVSILHSKRLADVPGASEWLATLFAKTRSWLTREWLVEAMARLPGTWSLVEREALVGYDYSHLLSPTWQKAERIADQLFWASHQSTVAASGRLAPDETGQNGEST